MRAGIIVVVEEACVVGAVAWLLWRREGRKLGRGHEPGELEDTLKGAEATPETGKIGGT
jgi:hypothetical protein